MSVYTNPQVCVAIPKFSQVTCQGRYLWFALYLLPQFLSLDASSTRVEHLPGSHVCHKACHGLGVPFKAVLASCRAKPRPTSAQCQALSPPRKMAQPGHTPRAAASRSSAKQQGTVSSLRNGRLGASGTAQPCCQLTCKMWTALVLIWVSSWSLSESHLTAPHPRYSVLNKTLENSEQNSSVETITRVLNEMSARMTSVTPSPITLTRGTWGGDPTSPAVTAGTTHRTEAGASATAEGTPDGATSGVPTPPVPASDWQTPSSPHTRAPGSGTLSGPATHTTPTPATGAPTAAAALASVSGPLDSHGHPGHTPGHATASPTVPLSPQTLNASTQGPTVQAPTGRTAADAASRPAPTLLNTTPEPASPSSASASTTVGTTTKAPQPAASTAPAPAPHSSPAPPTRPSPVTSMAGAAGPGTTQTPEQGEPEAAPGPASVGPTPASSGDSKVPATDACQLSTQGRYLVVSSEPLAQSPAYESYKRKDYTQVDYLINAAGAALVILASSAYQPEGGKRAGGQHVRLRSQARYAATSRVTRSKCGVLWTQPLYLGDGETVCLSRPPGACCLERFQVGS
ncbi:uncharacterized protein C11orf24 homolog isoform X6 [Lagenorhynchus albirostris]|uniref:uncharacterized protein C11orf24 homolog isoform X6 n=1 Tax=Lagenorhynchus albirostris TaxID=27610 RepID=UPI0028F15F81|nr:uncharacterized protein C11orf24 homolog isoform X6 [Lagenorhynchus albirostris]